jgi:hypothetical protein
MTAQVICKLHDGLMTAQVIYKLHDWSNDGTNDLQIIWLV